MRKFLKTVTAWMCAISIVSSPMVTFADEISVEEAPVTVQAEESAPAVEEYVEPSYEEPVIVEEEAYAEPDTEEVVPVVEEVVTEPVPEEQVPENVPVAEPVLTEESIEPVLEAPLEEVTEDPNIYEETPTEEPIVEEIPEEEPVPEEVVEEVYEPHFVTITYNAGKGGSVNVESETVDINLDEVKFSGSTAKADYKYSFVNWTDNNGNSICGSAGLMPDLASVSSDVTFTANFKKEVKKIHITYETTEGGTVTSDGEDVDVWADEISVSGSKAEADEGYEFSGWESEDEIISENTELIPELSDEASDMTFKAVFEKIEEPEEESFEEDMEDEKIKEDVSEETIEDDVVEETEIEEKEEEEAAEPEIINTAISAYCGSASALISGMMPEGSYATMAEVQVEVPGREVVAAFDITIFDADGNDYQPVDGSVTVILSMNTAIPENAEVQHMETAEADPETVAVTGQDGNSIEFEASHFSIYVIVTPEEHHTHTFIFEDRDGNEISRQILSDDESLKEEAAPGSSETFLGWFDGDTKFTGFGTMIKVLYGEMTASVTTHLRARYEVNRQVYFMVGSVDDGWRVLASKEIADGDYLTTENVTYPTADGIVVAGWNETPGSDDIQYEAEALCDTVVTSDMYLYPVFRSAHWMIYESNGGTLISPSYVVFGDLPVRPSDPVKAGYTFAGWYQDRDLTVPFDFNAVLDDILDVNVTAYAKWTPAVTTYTIAYWMEGYGGTADVLVLSRSMNATSEDVVSGAAYSGWYGDRTDYMYYEYDDEGTDKDVTVLGDGSTVVNVRYKRKTYTINFDLKDSSNTTVYATLEINGETYSRTSSNANSYPLYTIEVKYGDDISALWPTASEITASYTSRWGRTTTYYLNYWKGTGKNSNYATKRFEADAAVLPENPGTTSFITYTPTYTSSTTRTEAHYFLQNADGEYVERTDYTQIMYTSGTLGAKEIEGYTENASMRYSRNRVYRFYYDLNRYDLHFQTAGGEDIKIEENVPFSSDMDAYDGFVPEKPEGLADYYEFKGWFTSPELYDRSKFDFQTGKMPAYDLLLYAKWAPKKITIIYDLTFEGGDGTSREVEVDAGSTAPELPDPVREGYTFIGWATSDGKLFSFKTAVTDDISIVPRWMSNEQYHVLYNVNTGSGTVPSDDHHYLSGSQAVVLDGSNLVGPDNSKFLYWNTREDDSGTKYYAGSRIMVPENGIVLFAIYGNTDRGTKLVYDLNYETENRYIEETIAVGNEEYVIEYEPGRPGYIFLGWGKTPDQTENLLQVGDRIQVDTVNEANNILYAIWVKGITVTLNNELHAAEPSALRFTIKRTGKEDDVIYLRDGESRTYGLHDGDEITITQDSYTEYGIRTQYTVDGGDPVHELSWTYTATEDDEEIEITFSSRVVIAAPTGVSVHMHGVWILMVIGFVLIIGKRKLFAILAA